MNSQTAFLQLVGQIRITDLLIFVLAAGYIIPQLKKLYMWLRDWLRATENREQAIGNAEKLGDYHQQSIQIRNDLQKQVDEIKNDLAIIKNYNRENEAVKLGIQAILRDSIVSNYNKYKDRGYIPIYARESVKKYSRHIQTWAATMSPMTYMIKCAIGTRTLMTERRKTMFEDCVFKVDVDTQQWIKAAAVRAVKTMAQTFVATIGTAAVMGDVNWQIVASASVLSGILSVATSVAGIPEVSAK